MKKNQRQLKLRRNFITTALTNKKEAAEKLRLAAMGIENCRTTQDVVYALEEILFLSERTIYNDFSL